MDVRTYHSLMMGHTKLSQHSSVLQLYDEAVASGIQVRICSCVCTLST